MASMGSEGLKKLSSKSLERKSSDDNDGVTSLKKELELEQKAKDTIEWSNAELERSVRAMEANVTQLESGNFEADDSEIKQKYENQRQLNVQLQEQKRWLEHELEQVRLKIQNEKQYPLPDPFSLDWDNLSETELKRLVGQLEKTRNDLISDLREMQWRLDKEGKEFHHYDDFCRMYMAEIKNLNRILETLMRTGILPTTLSTGNPPQELNWTFLDSNSGITSGFQANTPSSPNKRMGSISPTRSRRSGLGRHRPSLSRSLPRKTGSPVRAHGHRSGGSSTDKSLPPILPKIEKSLSPKNKPGKSPARSNKSKGRT